MNKHTLVIAVAVAIATVGVAQAGPVINGQSPSRPSNSSTQLSPTQRGAVVAQIVRTWGPFVQQVHGTSASAWAGRMQGTFAAATDSNLQRAAGMKTFQGMVDALLGQHLTDLQVTNQLATQALVLKSGAKPALLGSTTADLVFTPLAPCRIADTRVVGGPIAGNTSRGFHGYTASNFSAQGGSATSDCGIPANPSGLMLNITVVLPAAPGYLTVFPFGTTQPLASNLNYKIGDIVGNEIAAKMTTASTDEFSVYSFGPTNVVVDVVGYFMAPQTTALDTVTASHFDTLAAGDNITVNVACPVGYALTGSGCFTSSTDGSTVIYGSGIAFGVQYCQYHNISGGDSTGSYAQCAKVPGR